MLTLQEVARAVGVSYTGPDRLITDVTTDSRKVKSGDLFVALKGERFDGHGFVDQAFSQGAVAAMVSTEILNAAGPRILVKDTRLALGQLAASWRQHFTFPIVGVTGSNGKTTVKEMLAAIFRTAGEGLATRGNLNNDIGVPLTLLALRDHHKFAVIEMGANHKGEIAYLTNLVRPDVAVVNNAGAAHLEGFGTLADVVAAKSEIFRGLGDDGVAVVNADDANSELFRRNAKPHRCITFGIDFPADITTSSESISQVVIDGHHITRFHLRAFQDHIDVSLPLMGRHNVMNALAASAAAVACGYPIADVARGLAQMQGAQGRLQLKSGPGGRRVIDDTYNANPSSFAAAINVLAGFVGPRLLVLGDMGELGPGSAELHQQVGARARDQGIESLYATGKQSIEAVRAFGKTGRHFDTCEALIAVLKDELAKGQWPNAAILVKGSRSMQMERVVHALCGEGATHGGVHQRIEGII
jgi:UDP-N-acetylmuramoyl-tripeptide--D-alanyl-D-alanine ligase